MVKKKVLVNGVVGGEVEATGDADKDAQAAQDIKKKGLHREKSTDDATDDLIFIEALALLRQTIEEVTNLTPKQSRELPSIEFRPTKMLWQTVGRCEAIHNLLTDGLLDEATILLRSLMFDTHRLIYMDQHRDQRVALMLGLEEEQAKNWEAMAKIAKKAGRDVSGLDEKVSDMRQQIQKAMGTQGIRRLKKFPLEGANIAKSIGRLTDLIGHKMYSISTHGASLSLFPSVHRTEDGTVHLSFRNKNPGYVSGVAWSASEYLFEGTITLAKAQEWDTLDELKERYADINEGFEKLQKREEEPA